MAKDLNEWIRIQNDPKEERFSQREMEMIDTMRELQGKIDNRKE